MQGSSSYLSPNKNQSLPALSPQEAVWLTVNSSKGSGGTISISSLLKRRESRLFTSPTWMWIYSACGCWPLCTSYLHLHKINGVGVWSQREAGADASSPVWSPLLLALCPQLPPWWHFIWLYWLSSILLLDNDTMTMILCEDPGFPTTHIPGWLIHMWVINK